MYADMHKILQVFMPWSFVILLKSFMFSEDLSATQKPPLCILEIDLGSLEGIKTEPSEITTRYQLRKATDVTFRRISLKTKYFQLHEAAPEGISDLPECTEWINYHIRAQR